MAHVGIAENDRALLIDRLPGIAGGFAPGDRDDELLLAGQITAGVDEVAWPDTPSG